MKTRTRWMNVRDLPQVEEMEDLTYGGESAKWRPVMYRRMLRRQDCKGVVADIDGAEVGAVMIYELTGCECRLRRLIVHPDLRESGIGTSLLRFLEKRLSATRTVLVCDVPDERLAMHELLKSCGWLATGVSGDNYRFELTLARRDELESQDKEAVA